MGPRENEEDPEDLGLLPGWGVFDPDAEIITIEDYEGPHDDSKPYPYDDVHCMSRAEREEYLNGMDEKTRALVEESRRKQLEEMQREREQRLQQRNQDKSA